MDIDHNPRVELIQDCEAFFHGNLITIMRGTRGKVVRQKGEYTEVWLDHSTAILPFITDRLKIVYDGMN